MVYFMIFIVVTFIFVAIMIIRTLDNITTDINERIDLLYERTEAIDKNMQWLIKIRKEK